MSVFSRLYEVVNDPQKLSAVYGDILGELFQSVHWERGVIGHRRVSWMAGPQARTDDADTFKSPGLYIWGAEERPFYIGITCGSFGKRFSRYIWAKKSQCKLARDFEQPLITSGIDGFPPEIRDWYAKSYGGSTVRLEGAVRFAKEGLHDVWFVLLPNSDHMEIENLEKHLIPIAQEWNRSHGFRTLLNVEFNRKD